MNVPVIVVSSINLEEMVIDTVFSNSQNLVIDAPELQVLRACCDLNIRRAHFSAFGYNLLKAKEILEACGGIVVSVSSPTNTRLSSISFAMITSV